MEQQFNHGLTAQEAEHYREHLSKRGVAVDIDPPLVVAESLPPFPELIYDFDEDAPVGDAALAPQPVEAQQSPSVPTARIKDVSAKPVSRPAFKAPSRPWVKSGG